MNNNTVAPRRLTLTRVARRPLLALGLSALLVALLVPQVLSQTQENTVIPSLEESPEWVECQEDPASCTQLYVYASLPMSPSLRAASPRTCNRVHWTMACWRLSRRLKSTGPPPGGGRVVVSCAVVRWCSVRRGHADKNAWALTDAAWWALALVRQQDGLPGVLRHHPHHHRPAHRAARAVRPRHAWGGNQSPLGILPTDHAAGGCARCSDLRGNALNGTVPTEFGLLDNLRDLYAPAYPSIPPETFCTHYRPPDFCTQCTLLSRK